MTNSIGWFHRPLRNAKTIDYKNVLLVNYDVYSDVYNDFFSDIFNFSFQEQGSENSDMLIDRSIAGSLQGLWTAYVTMTTVG